MNQVQFIIQGLPEGYGKLLDIWQVEPNSAVAFNPDGSKADNNEVIAWSVSLPAEPHLAQNLIEMQANLIGQRERQMRVAEQNLRDLNLFGPAASAFTSRNIGFAESPEMTLRRNLAQIQGRDSVVAFGLRDWLPHWQKTITDYKSHVDQILSLCRPTMRVETKIEQRQVACTIVSVSGHFQTISTLPLNGSHVLMHHQILALTLQSRLALLQLLATVGSGAVMIAIKLGLPFPAGPLLAMPAVWRYLQDLQQQVETLQQIGRKG